MPSTRSSTPARTTGRVPPSRALPTALVYLAALIGGALFAALQVPLAWMIGALVFSAGAQLAGMEARPPRGARMFGQVVVGTAVGLYFTPAALTQVSAHLTAMLVAAFLTIAIGAVSAVLMRRLAGLDTTTAFFACVPGGPVEMALMAERAGAQSAPVALAQTVRIAALVLIIPPAITYSGIGGVADPAHFAGEVVGLELIGLAAAAVAVAHALRLARVPNPWFLGPVAAGAAMAVTETTSTTVPFVLIAAGQVCLGTALGTQFDRAFVRRVRHFLKGIAACTAFLMVTCAGMGVAIAAVSDLPVAAMILATAPGSLTEMCLTAKALDLSVAMVTAFHLVRLFIVVPLTPLLFDALRRWWPALVEDAPPALPTDPGKG
jgi:hypothetical protein